MTAPAAATQCSPDRFADRLAEAIRLSKDPAAFAQLPRWTQRVMLILKEQLVPAEFVSMLASDQAIFAEGVCVAWIAHARDIIQDRGSADGQFARQVAERLTRAPGTDHVVEQVETGAVAASASFQEHVMHRLFAASAAERRAFSEGLALGNRAYDLFARQATERMTDATSIYLLLWLYWPEIAQLGSVGEAARFVESQLGANKNLTGRHWEERFRKLANRLGLSYRAKQSQRKRLK